VTVAALAVAAGASTPSALAAAPPAESAPPVVLDALRPVAMAADGERLVWVRQMPGGGRALVVRDTPTSPDRVVVPRLRVAVTRVALGTDAAGRPTAVLATGGTADPDEWTAAAPSGGALYGVRVDRPGHVRALRVTRGAGAEVAPSLRRGVLSFARVERVGRRRTMTLRVGALARASSRVVWSGSPDRPIVATAVGAGRRVAFTTHASPGEENVWNLRVARPGHPTRSLERLSSGFNSNRGYGPLTMDTAGRRVVVSRWLSNGDGAVLSTHDLRTRRRVGTRRLDEVEIAVPLGSAGVAAHQTSIYADCDGTGPESGPDACPLTFLPAG
jgi:hypothetical protein